MADRTARRKQPVHHAHVVRADTLTPHMTRVVLGGEGLAAFPEGEQTDRYVKLLFPVPGVEYPEPFDMAAIRADFPRDQWPATRTYTVREWDPDARELTLDFVVHGDTGLAGPWARRAKPGDEVRFLGPGGGYAPDPAAGWHLLAGDESALPAIAAALERLESLAERAGDGAPPVRALIEVAGAEEEQKLTVPQRAEVTWLHRGSHRVGEQLIAAVRELEFPEGQVHAFVHGEAGFVKELRRHLRLEREVPREWLSISGYWRLGHDEDGWQASKKEWNAKVEAEQEGAEAQSAA
jgi:NADPH-dependent ferric siderophore reductase